MEPIGKLLSDKLEGPDERIKDTMAMKSGETMVTVEMEGEQ